MTLEGAKPGMGQAARDLIDEIGCEDVRFDEALSRHTTLKMGGPADVWLAPSSIEQVIEVCRLAATQGWPVWAIGGGSNVLVGDAGVRGVVLSTRRLRGIERVKEYGIHVQSGVSTGKLLSSALSWELGGLEFLGGVPGSVGGGLVMNAGTYLGEFVDVAKRVESVRFSDGELVQRDAAECGFGYRTSSLPSDELVVAAELRLCPRNREAMKKAVRDLRDRRREREPNKVSNAGSVFKNPEGDYAGRLLEEAGFKGTKIGAAQCSEVHANWFVNTGGASSLDMLALIERGRDLVWSQFGIALKLEWKLVGEGCKISPCRTGQ